MDMDGDVKRRVLASNAREYVMIHHSLKYAEIEAHAATEYATEVDRKAFVNAVLHADIAIAYDRVRETPTSPQSIN
jgi:hypothetical protein